MKEVITNPFVDLYNMTSPSNMFGTSDHPDLTRISMYATGATGWKVKSRTRLNGEEQLYFEFEQWEAPLEHVYHLWWQLDPPESFDDFRRRVKKAETLHSGGFLEIKNHVDVTDLFRERLGGWTAFQFKFMEDCRSSLGTTSYRNRDDGFWFRFRTGIDEDGAQWRPGKYRIPRGRIQHTCEFCQKAVDVRPYHDHEYVIRYEDVRACYDAEVRRDGRGRRER